MQPTRDEHTPVKAAATQLNLLLRDERHDLPPSLVEDTAARNQYMSAEPSRQLLLGPKTGPKTGGRLMTKTSALVP
jgi:hypothetical protein